MAFTKFRSESNGLFNFSSNSNKKNKREGESSVLYKGKTFKALRLQNDVQKSRGGWVMVEFT